MSSCTELVTLMTLECRCLQEWSQRPFAANITRRHLDSHGHLLQPDLSCQDWVTFFPQWVTLLTAGFTCFNIWLMTKWSLKKNERQGQLSRFPYQLLETQKIIYPLPKGIWKQLGQKRVFLGLTSVEWGMSLKGLNHNRMGEHLKANKRRKNKLCRSLKQTPWSKFHHKFCNTVDLCTTEVWTAKVHLEADFFFAINIYMTINVFSIPYDFLFFSFLYCKNTVHNIYTNYVLIDYVISEVFDQR